MILMIEKAWPFVYNQRMGICLEELMIDKLQCTNCGNEFIPGKPWSKYCGYSCVSKNSIGESITKFVIGGRSSRQMGSPLWGKTTKGVQPDDRAPIRERSQPKASA